MLKSRSKSGSYHSKTYNRKELFCLSGSCKKCKALFAVCASLIVLIVLGIIVFAANVSGLTVDGLTASYDKGTWTANGNGLSGSATGTAGGTCSDAESTTSILTLKNTKGSTAQLAFDYAKPTLATGGYVKIDGTSVTSAGSFTKELSNNSSITIELYSGNAGANTSSISITNISLVAIKSVTMTFVPGTGGSMKVNGTTINASTSITQQSNDVFELVAIPDSTHQFMGWKSNTSNNYLNLNASWNAYFENNETLTPVFKPKGTPTFLVGEQYFYDLNDASTYATNNSISKISLIYFN